MSIEVLSRDHIGREDGIRLCKAGTHPAVLMCRGRDNTIRWTAGERLNHLFEDRCDRFDREGKSGQLAVVTEDVALTFRELDDRANQAARYLLDQGLAPGDRIGLLLDKSVNCYVALLAVLKIGAAYVPLDPSFPPDRVAFILEDAGVEAIVSVSRYAEALEAYAVRRILLDAADREIDAKPTARLGQDEAPPADDQLFYVIYTSGTTGKPKGIAIDHAGICNFVRVAGEVYGIGVGDLAYQGITLAFDFHVEDLWVPLIAGATLIAGKSGQSLFGEDLHAFLSERKVTLFPCVPTLWATLESDLPNVRVVLLSGENVPQHLVVRWHREGRRILNAYGPTECSVSSTLRVLEPDRPVTIGCPLPTYTVVILDEHEDAVVADGEVGEIGIAGVALARGYLNRPDLTAEKFIPDFLDLPNNPSKRIYRTGDYGRIREDGELDFLGRIDTQVKIRGYRIELGEIEAVLAQVPQIAQAVVNPHESAPGATELVAYYTRRTGAGDISPAEVSETLRRLLPGYMVPAFLEELPAIPMTSNNKVDRKALPAPGGPRLSASSCAYVAPRTETERVLSEALAEVMEIDRASVTDDFFQDLGAHSLLMARFGAEIRRRLGISSVAMQDIYQNPTIEALAGHLESLPDETADQGQHPSVRENFHYPSDLAYFGCGALQLAFLAGGAALGLWLLVEVILWSYGAMPDVGATYLRLIAFTGAVAILYSAFAIAAKWLLIGRWKTEAIPVWSLRYLRFWIVKTLVRTAPMAAFGDPFYNLYLRLLGAKIGRNAVIHAQRVPVCTDLITVGDNATLMNESVFNGYKAQSNLIRTGPISIGANAFVSEAGILDINTVMEDDAQLGTASSLHEGQCVPRGKRYHGCPARETTADYCTVEPRACTPLRRWSYAVLILLISCAALPVPLLGLYLIWPYLVSTFDIHAYDYSQPFEGLLDTATEFLPLSLVTFLGLGVLYLLYLAIVPRVLTRFLEPDKAYVLYGAHYFIHRWIMRTSHSVFFDRLFGDSSGIVHYMRWIGYRLNKIVQTGSNFGISQRHDNPVLCDVGSGTMVSGGIKFANESLSNTSFKVGTVKIGARNYLGNYVYVPAASKVGENCLIATKALVPIDGPVLKNIGLLGSPPFEIPRANERDLRMAEMDEATRRRQLRAKNRYNLGSASLLLLSSWFAFYVVGLIAIKAAIYYLQHRTAAILVASALAFGFTILWSWLIERASLHFGWLAPRIVPLLNEYFWFHERVWKLTSLWLIAPIFAGTPFKNFVTRLEGVRIGRKVFDDGCYFDEHSMIEIGDYTNLNDLCVIQPHSLEESVFKSGRVKIGMGCTLGAWSNLHYDVTLGDFVVIDTNSFLMKGEIVDSNSFWSGNPARAARAAEASRRVRKSRHPEANRRGRGAHPGAPAPAEAQPAGIPARGM
jgi:non-ribosomal peptide synthetase-like protein